MFNVIITTNSPGEVSAWVKPIIKKINKIDEDKNIYVFTPPCVFSSGNEGKVLSNMEGVKNSYDKKMYLKFILFNKKPDDFLRTTKGFVLFLGGDFMHAYLLGKKLNYPVYAYTERDFGFIKSIKKFYVSDQGIYDKLKNNNVDEKKIILSGNLMYDAINLELDDNESKRIFRTKNKILINLLPGSRPKEVKFTLPLFLNFIENISKKKNNLKFIISKAEFISDNLIDDIISEMVAKNDIVYDKNDKIINAGDIEVKVYDKYLYNIMNEADLAITIPGTNNLELAVLNTPMLVLLPLNKAEDIPLPGLLGLIGEIPVLGKALKKIIIPKMAEKRKYMSLVNLIYDQDIVPELVGKINSKELTDKVIELLENEGLAEIKKKLKNIEVKKGASDIIINDILNDIS